MGAECRGVCMSLPRLHACIPFLHRDAVIRVLPTTFGAGDGLGGDLGGNELFQQALQKNLDLIRNRLYNGPPPPDAPGARAYENYMQPQSRPAPKTAELSAWLERVYGASLTSVPSTKATRVRPTSATAASRQVSILTSPLHSEFYFANLLGH
jgi:hypothetical protein